MMTKSSYVLARVNFLDLVEREHVGLVVFGHDGQQWQTLKKALPQLQVDEYKSHRVALCRPSSKP